MNKIELKEIKDIVLEKLYDALENGDIASAGDAYDHVRYIFEDLEEELEKGENNGK